MNDSFLMTRRLVMISSVAQTSPQIVEMRHTGVVVKEKLYILEKDFPLQELFREFHLPVKLLVKNLLQLIDRLFVDSNLYTSVILDWFHCVMDDKICFRMKQCL
jgi:hypothetical protein